MLSSSYYYCNCIHQQPLCTPDKNLSRKKEEKTCIILPRVGGKAANAVSDAVSYLVSLVSAVIWQSVSRRAGWEGDCGDGDGLSFSIQKPAVTELRPAAAVTAFDTIGLNGGCISGGYKMCACVCICVEIMAADGLTPAMCVLVWYCN